MPQTHVVLFRDADGTVPILDWFDGLPIKVVAKCQARLVRLRALGFELRRPEADLLRDGIYELRVGHQGINSACCTFFTETSRPSFLTDSPKERVVPPMEIDRAIRRRRQYLASPARHTQEM